MNKSGDTGAGCTIEEARAAKDAALGVFKRIAKVTGVGITRSGDGYGLKVNVQSAPPVGVTVPKEVRGVPVRVEVTGTITKRAKA